MSGVGVPKKGVGVTREGVELEHMFWCNTGDLSRGKQCGSAMEEITSLATKVDVGLEYCRGRGQSTLHRKGSRGVVREAWGGGIFEIVKIKIKIN